MHKTSRIFPFDRGCNYKDMGCQVCIFHLMWTSYTVALIKSWNTWSGVFSFSTFRQVWFYLCSISLNSLPFPAFKPVSLHPTSVVSICFLQINVQPIISSYLLTTKTDVHLWMKHTGVTLVVAALITVNLSKSFWGYAGEAVLKPCSVQNYGLFNKNLIKFTGFCREQMPPDICTPWAGSALPADPSADSLHPLWLPSIQRELSSCLDHPPQTVARSTLCKMSAGERRVKLQNNISQRKETNRAYREMLRPSSPQF